MRSVLIVEDNALVYPTIIDGLSFGGGFAVAHAADGCAALLALESNRPDLALIDVGLPGLSGLAVARRAVEIEIPAVLMSDNGEMVEKSAAYGFPVLAKPFRVDALAARFEEVMAEAVRLNRAMREQMRRGAVAAAQARASRRQLSEDWRRVCDKLVF
jgi:DNA-binding response OmpR family regulator